jgi:hypothetical protein
MFCQEQCKWMARMEAHRNRPVERSEQPFVWTNGVWYLDRAPLSEKNDRHHLDWIGSFCVEILTQVGSSMLQMY